MIRALLLVCIFVAVSTTLSLAQLDPLGKAAGFAVLANSCVSNTGTTAVTGKMGIASGKEPDDTGELLLMPVELADVPSANEAKADAKSAYDTYAASQLVTKEYETLENYLTAGVHVIKGDAVLKGLLSLDGKGRTGEKFIIIVEGSLKTNLPTGINSSNSVMVDNGADAKNVYWIVKGDVDLDGISLFQGNILAQRDITLHTGVAVIGRAISLEGCVNLNSNNIFLPNIIYTDLSVTKVAYPDQEYNVGGEVAYTITAKNGGPGDATGVVVEEKFPVGSLEFLRTEPAESDFVRNIDGTYQWSIGALGRDQEKSLKVIFRILSPGAIINKVTVGGDLPDPTPDDNEDEEPIEVPLPAANLSVSKTAAAGNYALGDKVTYTITAQNAGPGDAVGVVVREEVPEGLEYASATTAKGSYDSSTNLWTIGELANGESAELTIEFTIVKPGRLANGVEVIADNTDPTPGDNEDEEPIDVPCPALDVTFTGNPTVCVGTEETYTVAENVAASTYTWSLPDGWEILDGEGTNSIVVKVGAAAGDVTVSVEDICGNSSSAGLSVIVNDKPAAPVITGEASACVGTQLTFTIDEVPGAANPAWTVPETWTIVSDPNAYSITVEVGTEPGAITATIVNECGTSDAATLSVAPLFAPIETNAILGNSTVCEYGETVTYTLATIEEGVTYTWSLPKGWTVVSGDGTGTITVNTTATAGTVSVVAKNSCNTAQPVSLDVGITVPPVAPAVIRDNSNVCDGLTYSVNAVQGATSYNWTVPAGFTITSGQGTTTIKVRADSPTSAGQVTVVALNGTCSSVATSATMDASLADGQLNFPKAFSPNGDGKNDTWFITNLEKFPTNEIVIFNRWGSEVFKKRNYQNDWSASKLEQGTYFYKVRVTVCGGVEKEFTGSVTLFR